MLCMCGLMLTQAQAGDLRAIVTDGVDQSLPDAVVLATPLDATTIRTAHPADKVLDQIDKQFVPYVTPVYVGTAVRFPNKDNVRHHVYSFSRAKKFELPLYTGTPSAPVVFDKPGVVTLGCNIHDWMIGYVYVADTPFFDKTGTDGTVTISELPPGEYQARVWHQRMEMPERSTVKRLSIAKTGVTAVTWHLALNRELHPRRAPIAGQRGY